MAKPPEASIFDEIVELRDKMRARADDSFLADLPAQLVAADHQWGGIWDNLLGSLLKSSVLTASDREALEALREFAGTAGLVASFHVEEQERRQGMGRGRERQGSAEAAGIRAQGRPT